MDAKGSPATNPTGRMSAIRLAGLTAWQGLFDYGRLRKGDRVLIHGAAGGVGQFATQLARWRGGLRHRDGVTHCGRGRARARSGRGRRSHGCPFARQGILRRARLRKSKAMVLATATCSRSEQSARCPSA